jgi:hypothetical protein
VKVLNYLLSQTNPLTNSRLQLVGARWLFTLLVITGLFLSGAQSALAETLETSNGSNKVSASVGDQDPPSTPILIAPSDGSWLTTQRPTFSWYASTDNIGVHHYQLVIDGVVAVEDIPTSNNETSAYTLTYNSGTSAYTLVPKTNRTDGQHTWRIVAVDAGGNASSSATWSFAIDSQAPNFVLNTLGNVAVSISAQDSSTWPSSPITVSDNPVLLKATGEANSVVTVTVTWDSAIKQTISTQISSAGDWQTLLGIVPRDKTITLDFVIRDQVGLVSVIQTLQFIIPSPTLPWLGSTLAPTATPTLPPGVTPEPTEEVVAVITPEPTPTPASVVATIFDWAWPGGQNASRQTIPWIQEIYLRITSKLPSNVGDPLSDAVTTPPSTQPFWWQLAAVLLVLLGPSAAWLFMLLLWKKAWWDVGPKAWWSTIGWLRPARQNIVLDQILAEAVPWLKITLHARSTAALDPVKIETLFGDHTGQFCQPSWPPSELVGSAGQYQLTFSTPTGAMPFMPLPNTWPKTFTPLTFLHHRYQGGWLSLRPQLPFPTLMALVQSTPSALTKPDTAGQKVVRQIGLVAFNWSQQTGVVPIGLLLGCILISSLWGGWLNWLMVIYEVGLLAQRAIQQRKNQVWQFETTQLSGATETASGASGTQKLGKAEWLLITSKVAGESAWWINLAVSQKLSLPKHIQQVILHPLSTGAEPSAQLVKKSPVQVANYSTSSKQPTCVL